MQQPAKCKAYLREQCQPGAPEMANKTLLFEFTRKTFHDSFPLPYVLEDVAQFLLVRQEYAYLLRAISLHTCTKTL